MTEDSPLDELMDRLEEEYPESNALAEQPDWIHDLAGAHDSIEMAYVRKRGPSPEPKVELRVANSVSGAVGWHRIEVVEDGWLFPHSDPPAGVATALQWLRENVAVTEFRAWFDDHA